VNLLNVCDLKSYEGVEKIIFELGKLRRGINTTNSNESRVENHSIDPSKKFVKVKFTVYSSNEIERVMI
jgi:hypothetical protein